MKLRVKVPKLGLTIEEVTLSSWEKQEGDVVSAGEVIATIEADKASYEVVAPSDGVLASHLAQEGDELAVGTDLAVISV